jgi:hypothetical protein
VGTESAHNIKVWVGGRCRAGARRFYIGYNNISAGARCLLFVFHHKQTLQLEIRKKNCVSNNYHTARASEAALPKMQRIIKHRRARGLITKSERQLLLIKRPRTCDVYVQLLTAVHFSERDALPRNLWPCHSTARTASCHRPT